MSPREGAPSRAGEEDPVNLCPVCSHPDGHADECPMVERVQPCGHGTRFLRATGEGTHHCAECERIELLECDRDSLLLGIKYANERLLIMADDGADESSIRHLLHHLYGTITDEDGRPMMTRSDDPASARARGE